MNRQLQKLILLFMVVLLAGHAYAQTFRPLQACPPERCRCVRATVHQPHDPGQVAAAPCCSPASPCCNVEPFNPNAPAALITQPPQSKDGWPSPDLVSPIIVAPAVDDRHYGDVLKNRPPLPTPTPLYIQTLSLLC